MNCTQTHISIARRTQIRHGRNRHGRKREKRFKIILRMEISGGQKKYLISIKIKNENLNHQVKQEKKKSF